MKKAFAAVALGLACLGLAAGGSATQLGTARPLAATGFRSVVDGAVVTQGFGCTPLALEPVDVRCASGHFHTGVDLAVAARTPVFAAAAGRCHVVDDLSGYGLHVLLAHAGGVTSLYGHLELALVRDGEVVTAGQEIGLVGSSGMSTGPHLHFEIRVAGSASDPSVWLPLLQGSKPTSGLAAAPGRSLSP